MASGRLVPISISKTVFSPLPVMPSTAMPTEVRSCARRRLSTLGSTNSRSHVTESFISNLVASPRQSPGRRHYNNLSKLFQEPNVAVEEQLNVVHSVFQNRDAVCAHAEGKAADLLGIVIHKSVHVGIDHAAAQNFDPSGLLAGTARLCPAFAAASTNETRHHHLRTGLREREERRPEAGLHTRAEKCLHGVIKR